MDENSFRKATVAMPGWRTGLSFYRFNPYPVGEEIAYRIPLNEYFWDRLESAFAEIDSLGVMPGFNDGWYRTVQAEWETRKVSALRRLGPSLQLECVDAEVGVEIAELERLVVETCRGVGDRLGWDQSTDCLITISARAAVDPWATGPYGYFVDKYPYDKVVIPVRSLASADTFERVLRHEYAHAATLNLTHGHQPRWLSEAVSQWVSNETDSASWRELATGAAPWRRVHELGAMFSQSVQMHRTPSSLTLAYAQSAIVGQFLASVGGDASIGELLRVHADESVLYNLQLTVLGRTRTEGAMRRVYGMSEAEALTRAFDWLKSQPGPT